MVVDDVLRQLEAAFADAARPRHEVELAPPGIEAPYVIAHFFGKTREQLEAAHFPASLYMEDFTYMSEAGVHYYLPAVLRIMLARLDDDELWLFLHAYLRRIGTRPPALALIRLTPARRAAIAAWAEHLEELWGASSDRGREAGHLADHYGRRWLSSDP